MDVVYLSSPGQTFPVKKGHGTMADGAVVGWFEWRIRDDANGRESLKYQMAMKWTATTAATSSFAWDAPPCLSLQSSSHWPQVSSFPSNSRPGHFGHKPWPVIHAASGVYTTTYKYDHHHNGCR